jgi:general secretion pathway protein G
MRPLLKAILLLVAVPNLAVDQEPVQVEKAPVTVEEKVQEQFQIFKIVLMMYRSEHGFMPTTGQGLSALVKKPEWGPVGPRWKPLLGHLPVDPFGQHYQYELVDDERGNGTRYMLISLGPDGVRSEDDITFESLPMKRGRNILHE